MKLARKLDRAGKQHNEPQTDKAKIEPIAQFKLITSRNDDVFRPNLQKIEERLSPKATQEPVIEACAPISVPIFINSHGGKCIIAPQLCRVPVMHLIVMVFP